MKVNKHQTTFRPPSVMSCSISVKEEKGSSMQSMLGAPTRIEGARQAGETQDHAHQMGKPVRTVHKHRLRCPTSKSTRAAGNHADPFGSVTPQQRQGVVGFCLHYPSSARGKSAAPLSSLPSPASAMKDFA